MALFSKFSCDTRAATAIEYGLIALLIAVAIIGGTSLFGVSLSDMWTNTSRTIGGILTG